jgi:hypothetical protein
LSLSELNPDQGIPETQHFARLDNRKFSTARILTLSSVLPRNQVITNPDGAHHMAQNASRTALFLQPNGTQQWIPIASTRHLKSRGAILNQSVSIDPTVPPNRMAIKSPFTLSSQFKGAGRERTISLITTPRVLPENPEIKKPGWDFLLRVSGRDEGADPITSDVRFPLVDTYPDHKRMMRAVRQSSNARHNPTDN